MTGSSDSGAAMRQQQQQQQAQIQQGMSQLNSVFSQFSPSFYQQRAADYNKFAMPQLADQAQNMWSQLTSKLANQGLLKSSAAGKLGSKLNTTIGQQRQGIVAEGQNQANQLQRTVEGQRAQLVGQLESSADPASTTQLAYGTAAGLSAPSTFAPLGNLFGSFGNMYLANQVGQGGNVGPYLYGTGLGGSGGLLGQGINSPSGRIVQ